MKDQEDRQHAGPPFLMAEIKRTGAGGQNPGKEQVSETTGRKKRGKGEEQGKKRVVGEEEKHK